MKTTSGEAVAAAGVLLTAVAVLVVSLSSRNTSAELYPTTSTSVVGTTVVPVPADGTVTLIDTSSLTCRETRGPRGDATPVGVVVQPLDDDDHQRWPEHTVCLTPRQAGGYVVGDYFPR